jgi:aryl-alcohol dehydrogenase-like predicted oxidoreductase
LAEIHESVQFLHDTQMGLGAWAWGDRIMWGYGDTHNDSDIEQAARISLAAGINLIDTAEVYGSGRSEVLTGQFVQNAPGPVCVATKFFPMPWRILKRSVQRALRHSLERLRMDHVHLYQIHWPSPIVPIETYVEGLALMHHLGLIKAVGVSNYNKNQMQRAITTLAKFDIPLASNQVPYSLLDRAIEKNGLLARCQELGVRLIAYSPLEKGLLTGKYSTKTPPPGLRGGRYAGLLPRLEPLIKLMTEIGQDVGGKAPAQVALNWCICKGTLPIPGAKNANQAEMNAGALGWRLKEEQIKSLDEMSDKVMA